MSYGEWCGEWCISWFSALTAERGLSDTLSPSGLTIVSDMAPAFCMRRRLIWFRCSGAAAGGALAAPSGGQRRILRLARVGGGKLHTHAPAAPLLLLLELVIGLAGRPSWAEAIVGPALDPTARFHLLCSHLRGGS